MIWQLVCGKKPSLLIEYYMSCIILIWLSKLENALKELLVNFGASFFIHLFCYLFVLSRAKFSLKGCMIIASSRLPLHTEIHATD